MPKHVAIYVRVSSESQDTASQEAELLVEAQRQTEPVKWYREKASGKTMDRPVWRKVEAEILAGRISKVIVWRLDRLGRTARGLTDLFETLLRCHTGLCSVRDYLDLSTTAGRLMANVLASVAQYETEVRAERVKAGQAVARAKGKTWGGSKKGHRTVTEEQVSIIRRLKQEGESIMAIRRTTGLSRPTIYGVLAESA